MPPPDFVHGTVLQRARRGDLHAFRQLVQQHQLEVFDHARRLIPGSEAVEVAQEVFVLLHASIARISGAAHLRHWLLRAVAQHAAPHPLHDAARPDFATPAAVTIPGEDFTARVMARVELRWSHRRPDFASVTRARRRRPRGLAGAAGAIVVAGALLLLAWIPGRLQEPATSPAAGSPQPAPASVAPADQAPLEPRSAATTPSALVDAAPPAASFTPRTVVVLPPRHASRDPEAIAPVEALHAALIDELRRIPGVALLVPGVTAPPESPRHIDYLFSVASLDASTLSSGVTAFRIAGSSGTLSAPLPSPGRQWPVEVRVQPLAPGSGDFVSTLQIGEDRTSLPPLAARQAELLRTRMFPDARDKQQLMGRLRDTSLSTMERGIALEELLGTRRAPDPVLDAVDISVILAGASTMTADERARLWRNLRGSPRSELVDALVDSLRHDPDTAVRFEALATLAADHGPDARAVAAIEAASRNDPEEVVRMAARRARSGEADWRSYLLATLQDPKLPDEEKLVPLLLDRESATTEAELRALRSLLNDEEITAALGRLIRDRWFDTTQAGAMTDALDVMANAGIAPTSGLMVEMAGRVPGSAIITPVERGPPQISPAAMAWLQKNRSNPRARRILEDIARGRADPQVGRTIEQLMQQRPPPRRPD